MKNERFAFFVPVRSGSQRIQNKNTKPFSTFSNGLLELKLSQLIQVEGVYEIVVSTNDDECVHVAKRFSTQSEKIRIIKRPEILCTDQTKLTDLISYVTEVSDCEHIIWTHVTSPFFDAPEYLKAIHMYKEALENGYDSLMSVYPFMNFLWSEEENDLWNRKNDEKWPRTQDLKKLYEIDSAVFIASREIYMNHADRIGKNPFLFENDRIRSIDIDWETDFFMAEAIYEKLFLK